MLYDRQVAQLRKKRNKVSAEIDRLVERKAYLSSQLAERRGELARTTLAQVVACEEADESALE